MQKKGLPIFGISEAHPVLSKYSESRARCILKYTKSHMATELEFINNLIRDGRPHDAIERIDEYMAENGRECDEAFFLLGKAYTKLGDYRRAISNYNEALSLNRSSPAAAALAQLQEILDFYNTDLYNP